MLAFSLKRRDRETRPDRADAPAVPHDRLHRIYGLGDCVQLVDMPTAVLRATYGFEHGF